MNIMMGDCYEAHSAGIEPGLANGAGGKTGAAIAFEGPMQAREERQRGRGQQPGLNRGGLPGQGASDFDAALAIRLGILLQHCRHRQLQNFGGEPNHPPASGI